MEKTEITFVNVPMLHSAFDCGKGVPFNDFWDYIKIPDLFIKDLIEPYIITATGDSMLPEIKPGDQLVVDHRQEPVSGDKAAIWYNGNYIIKEIWQNNFSLYLRSLNKDYELIKVKEDDDIQILGKVTGIYRQI